MIGWEQVTKELETNSENCVIPELTNGRALFAKLSRAATADIPVIAAPIIEKASATPTDSSLF
jgi:hypothetical protein